MEARSITRVLIWVDQCGHPDKATAPTHTITRTALSTALTFGALIHVSDFVRLYTLLTPLNNSVCV